MPRRVLSGIVLNAGNKTARVLVTRTVKHPRYGKIIKRTQKYLVHDENNAAVAGTSVSFIECPPKSKRKAWEILPGNTAQAAAE